MNKALLSSKNMCWCTPQDFFDKLNAEFGFVLDPAATDKTAKSANAAQRKSKRRIRRNTLAGLRNRTLKAAGNARLIIRTKLSNVAKIALLQKKPIEREGKDNDN